MQMLKIIESPDSIITVINSKNYLFPKVNLYDNILNDDLFILNIDMQDLKELFIYGIPNNLKDYLLKKIRLYDESSEVNSFKYNGKEYWLDKLLRTSIANLINNSINTFSDDNLIEVILGDDIYLFTPNDLKGLLDSLEVYAYKCKVTTLKHLNNVLLYPQPTNNEEFEAYIDFIENYDYTAGYPDKIEL